MIGDDKSKGIIPLLFEEIFIRIANAQSEFLTYEVLVGMFEIYNEKVNDLLAPIDQRVSGGLKIRESKETGVFVENLTKRTVFKYEEFKQMMEYGNGNRSIQSTNMNAMSSRAHIIINVQFKKNNLVENKKSEKWSIINLVDLA